MASTIRWWEMSPLTRTSQPAAAAAAIRDSPAPGETATPTWRTVGGPTDAQSIGLERVVDAIDERRPSEPANAPMRPPRAWFEATG